jgi:UDP-4-amino-4,6-dideoxy-N-acetyl-beta-L-altrosamine transaminase/dTDP-4-dehydrorhamnose reductase
MSNRARNKLLITGVSGLLGNNLASYFKDKYEILGLYNSNPVTIRGIRTEGCDIVRRDSLQKVLQEFAPSIIIHCASLTNVDTCETDREYTSSVNIQATKGLVECISDKNAKLIYISTDSVYDGIKGDFTEDNESNPLNYYGQSKLDGESEVRKKENSLILRTNIFGWNIQNKESLGEWVINELKADRKISGFTDAFFSSIYTFELARIMDIAIQQDLSGTYNCGASDSCSKYEFAQKIAACFHLDGKLIAPISIDDFSFKAERGKNLTLNTSKLEKKIDYRLPTIDQSIESFYKDFKCGVPAAIKQKQHDPARHSSFISYGRQYIDENDIQTVVNVLRSDRITQGPKIEEFEKALAEYCGAKYAVAANSGTSALHIACLAAGIKEGDEAITSPNTFVASANCAVYCGAKPVFADVSPDTYNILSEDVEKKITRQTSAIIPVHFAGQSCDMETIKGIARKKEKEFNSRIVIIEDGCHALGSAYKDKPVGSCFYSDMTVMSFHPVKHITTGEGGAVLTNGDELYRNLKMFRSHGIVSKPDEFIYNESAYSSSVLNPWYYEQVDLGHNYRITDIQCALGLSQLKKLPMFSKRRREIVEHYNNAFSNRENVKVPFESNNCNSNFHLYVLLFDFEKIGMERARLMSELKALGIQTQVHYIPVHTNPFYRQKFGTNPGDCPNAEKYYEQCLSIPLYPAMSDSDIEKVTSSILSIT